MGGAIGNIALITWSSCNNKPGTVTTGTVAAAVAVVVNPTLVVVVVPFGSSLVVVELVVEVVEG